MRMFAGATVAGLFLGGLFWSLLTLLVFYEDTHTTELKEMQQKALQLKTERRTLEAVRELPMREWGE